MSRLIFNAGRLKRPWRCIRQLESFEQMGMLRKSSDQIARARFCREIDKNFSVIASAGAGKTRAVVDRIVTIAMDGREELLPRLIVVTYTNNAAQEFKRRIRLTLLQRLRS